MLIYFLTLILYVYYIRVNDFSIVGMEYALLFFNLINKIFQRLIMNEFIGWRIIVKAFLIPEVVSF